MKYNLEELHWQEFEILSFKVLQILISPSVQFIEGGNDKGRDILFEGYATKFNENYSGKWVFQVKHKSKLETDVEILSSLTVDLKKELEKVFVVNKFEYDNYILVTNKTINGAIFDELQNIYLDFKNKKGIQCKNFNIISYRHIESCIDDNDMFKWLYPNIINSTDFIFLIKNAINFNLENRKRGWLNGLEKQRPKFVYTQFFQRALEKLTDFPAIILSGPPKSGKTFNAEMLALVLSVFKDYQPILIDNPEEIESSYQVERKQVFICDDAFGKYSLSYRVEEWFNKLERIFNLADESHLLIFTSREYIFRAFINYGNEDAKLFLEKILVESHNYPLHEKLAMLKRYTILSNISESDKAVILSAENILVRHKNFSPETIRAFFANITEEKSGEQLKELKLHLDKPDSYLYTVFFKLSKVKQAVLLSVLCTVVNTQRSIYKTFDYLCDDLKLDAILDTTMEFIELDDSILKILKTESIEQIQFYHPSMQEFLIRHLINNNSGKLREVVLRNLNNELLSISVMGAFIKPVVRTDKENTITLQRTDLPKIKKGLFRMINNENVSIFQIASIYKWLKSDSHIIDLKIFDNPFFEAAKKLLQETMVPINSNDFYEQHKYESNSAWSEFLFSIKNTLSLYGVDFTNSKFNYLNELLENKKNEKDYWLLVFRIRSFSTDDYILQTVGKEWLNSFYKQLKNAIYELGYEIFGDDFPEFKQYNEDVKQKRQVEKLKDKPNRTWYPRFLDVRDKINMLKEIRGTNIGNAILERLSVPYGEIIRQSEFAKNRHTFNFKQGWWN